MIDMRMFRNFHPFFSLCAEKIGGKDHFGATLCASIRECRKSGKKQG